MTSRGDHVTWPTASLGSVVNLVGGGTPSKTRSDFWDGAIPWVSPKDMNGREVYDAADHITPAAVEESATQIVPAGSVLIVVRSGILARRFPVSVARTPVALNQDLKALLPGGPLLPDYLAYALEAKSDFVLRQCVKRGATVHSVDIGKLQQMRLSIPPPSEQRRIVEILDQADRLRRLRAEADAKADRIIPALLARALGNPRTWATDPRCKPLGELVEPMSGATPSKKIKTLWSGEVPWVSPKDVKRDFLLDTQDHVSASAVEEINLRLVPEGSALIVVRGMILARDVPLAINLRPVTINQDMKALTPKTREVNGAYVWAALYLARPVLQTLVRTAGHGTRKLDTPELMQFAIPPPGSDKLNAVNAVVEHHRLAIEQRQKSKTFLERLFGVVLSKAFDGHLTSAWREVHMAELVREMEQQAKALA